MVLSRDLQDLAADLEKRRELACIGGLLDRRAQHVAGNQELPGERIGLLLGQRPVAVFGAQEVVAELVRHRESLANRRIIRVDLDDLADQTGAQLAELVALADLEAALARDGMYDHGGVPDTVLAENLARLLPRVTRMRSLAPQPRRDNVQLSGWLIIDADHLGRLIAHRTIRAHR